MPTAAKLVAALAIAAVGWFAAEAFKTLMPPETVWGNFTPICAGIGAIVGWRVLGARAGRGLQSALGVGLSASAVLVGVVLFLFSGREMVLRALDRRYDGPMDATVSVFGIMLEYGSRMGDVQLLGILIGGGLMAGLLAEVASRLWR